MTLYEVIKKNKLNKPNGIAIRYFKYTETYAELLDKIDKTASSLVIYGIKQGDRVGICLPNSPELIHFLYAVNKIGAVAVMMNPKSPASEIHRQLEMTGCTMLVFSHISLKNICKMSEMNNARDRKYVCIPIMEHLPLKIKIAITRRILSPGDVRIYRKLYGINALVLKEFLKNDSYFEEFETNDSADAVVIFSGGTSGALKAVVHSSKSFNNSASACLETEKPWPKTISMLAVLPAFHIFGLTVAIHLPMTEGGCVYLVPFFNLGIITNIIRDGCPAFFPGVPTIFERLINYPHFIKLSKSKKLNFNEFRHGFVGGDNLRDDVRDTFNNIVLNNNGNGYISMGYGMSECCPVCVNNRYSSGEGSIGIPFDGMKIKICNYDTHEEEKEGIHGEIVIASTYLMTCGIEESGRIQTPEADENGIMWLRTGDIGWVKDNVLYYECRQRRIIKVSGNTIFASAIENILKDELVFAENIFVVPVPHKNRGQGAFVYVVTEHGLTDEKTLEICKKACIGKIISYAIPIGAICVKKSEIPYTAIGKIAWGELEKKAAERMH